MTVRESMAGIMWGSDQYCAGKAPKGASACGNCLVKCSIIAVQDFVEGTYIGSSCLGCLPIL